MDERLVNEHLPRVFVRDVPKHDGGIVRLRRDCQHRKLSWARTCEKRRPSLWIRGKWPPPQEIEISGGKLWLQIGEIINLELYPVVSTHPNQWCNQSSPRRPSFWSACRSLRLGWSPVRKNVSPFVVEKDDPIWRAIKFLGVLQALTQPGFITRHGENEDFCMDKSGWDSLQRRY